MLVTALNPVSGSYSVALFVCTIMCEFLLIQFIKFLFAQAIVCLFLFVFQKIGYDKAAACAKKAHKEGTTLKASFASIYLYVCCSVFTSAVQWLGTKQSQPITRSIVVRSITVRTAQFSSAGRNYSRGFFAKETQYTDKIVIPKVSRHYHTFICTTVES